MAKCEVCKQEEAIYAWQPFGPGEDAMTFTTLGSHYRGFAVIKIGDRCHTDLTKWENRLGFQWRGHWYQVTADKRLENTDNLIPF